LDKLIKEAKKEEDDFENFEREKLACLQKIEELEKKKRVWKLLKNLPKKMRILILTTFRFQKA